ncbi:Vang-like protein 1 [Dermatophagoides farinae]|uniref:Vang-like protein n=1 Tax=Dermatophagoides farinae TaxID=6954 RepID=A0A922L6S3_DERFA|nr:vang-like protein [Dermatophagoides farinae]KAH9522009.1 Vang-like protein 1 [Dermatophagoides farinae]
MNPSGSSSIWPLPTLHHHHHHHPDQNQPLASLVTDNDKSTSSAAILMANQSSLSPYSNGNGANVSIDTESLLSGYSDHRNKNKGLNGSATAAYACLLTNTTAVNNSSVIGTAVAPSPMVAATPNVILNPYHGNYQANTSHTDAQVHSVVSMRSAGRQSHHSNRNGLATKTIESGYQIKGNPQEIVRVSMSSPDDHWNDNTTAITGNTSDQSGSMDDLSKIENVSHTINKLTVWQLWSGTIVAIVLSVCAFLSPIVMTLLPRLELFDFKAKECGPECDGLVLSFLFKQLILATGSWAVFFRRPRWTMPRICVYRSTVLALIVVLLVAYWLFYLVRIADKRLSDEDTISYYSVVMFAISLVDALLFIHFLAILLLRSCHLDNEFFIKVVRSPDGHSQCYTLGRTSIQRASIWVLEKYYQDFPNYNPFLERLANRKIRRNSLSRQGLKFYDVDGVVDPSSANKSTNGQNNPLQLSPKSILAQNTAANAGRRWPKNAAHLNGGSNISDGRGNRRHDRDTTSHHSGHSGHHHHRHHSDRLHEIHEYERRVRKRKSRLINVTEEAFTHIKRVQQQSHGPLSTASMNPKEAAQAIFPTIARTLQKYLRATRQQARHSVQSILEHLSICLTYDLSPKTFLEKYLSPNNSHVGWSKNGHLETWNLISDTLVSRSIESDSQFLLRHEDHNVCLLVTINSMPYLNLIEQVVDFERTKFLFKLNSETSV